MASPAIRESEGITTEAEPVRFTPPPDLYALQPWRWIAGLAGDWALIVAFFWAFHALGKPWPLIPCFALLIGTRQHALGLLGHDATHRLALRSRKWNEWICPAVTGWPILVVLEGGYRPWHFEHHRELGTHDDPELTYRAHRPYQGRVTWLKVAIYLVMDLCGLGIPAALGFLWTVFPKQRPARFLGPILLWTAAIAVAAWFGALWIPLLWAWSLLTGFWAVFRVRTFTEHVSVPWRGKATSHRFTAGPLARFFFWPHNTHCHYEHHKWPQVPFYNLPRLRLLDAAHPVVPLRELFPWT